MLFTVGEKQDTASERVVDKRELALKSEAASAEEHSDQEPAAEAEVPSNNLRGPKSRMSTLLELIAIPSSKSHFMCSALFSIGKMTAQFKIA